MADVPGDIQGVPPNSLKDRDVSEKTSCGSVAGEGMDRVETLNDGSEVKGNSGRAALMESISAGELAGVNFVQQLNRETKNEHNERQNCQLHTSAGLISSGLPVAGAEGRDNTLEGGISCDPAPATPPGAPRYKPEYLQSRKNVPRATSPVTNSMQYNSQANALDTQRPTTPPVVNSVDKGPWTLRARPQVRLSGVRVNTLPRR